MVRTFWDRGSPVRCTVEQEVVMSKLDRDVSLSECQYSSEWNGFARISLSLLLISSSNGICRAIFRLKYLRPRLASLLIC
jgi:hypothetical protein